MAILEFNIQLDDIIPKVLLNKIGIGFCTM